jgi:hypothetical protein
MLGLQIIAIIFAFFMIYFALLNYKRKEIGKGEIILWIVIWVLTVFIVIFPDPLRKYAQNFSVSRLFDLMVIGGFILMLTMTAYSYIRVRKLQKQLEELVRKNAIKSLDKKDKKS